MDPNTPQIIIPSIGAPFFEDILTKTMHFYPTFVVWVKEVIGILIGISFPLSVALVIGIIYCTEQLKHIRRKEAMIYDIKIEPAYETATGGKGGETSLARQWDKISKHIASQNQNDWKQAIIEADMLLDEILNTIGYRGESVGEKLKRVEPGEMKSLEAAWEAHKTRNDIAHTPGFVLTQHEANHTIQLYRKVFEEFYYIQ